jgi:hypothetical protein
LGETNGEDKAMYFKSRHQNMGGQLFFVLLVIFYKSSGHIYDTSTLARQTIITTGEEFIQFISYLYFEITECGVTVVLFINEFVLFNAIPQVLLICRQEAVCGGGDSR